MRFRLITAPVGPPVEIVLKDTNGRIMALSRNIADNLGLELNDIIGGATADLLPEQFAMGYMTGDRKVMETGQSLKQEVTEEIDGSTHHYLNEIFPLKDGNGEITGTCSISSDITDLKQAEVRLRDAIESTPGGFVLYDANDRFVLCNQKYRNFYPQIDSMLVRGTKWEDLTRAAFERGAVVGAANNVEEWIRVGTHRHRSAQMLPFRG